MEKIEKNYRIEISHRTIIFTVLFILLLNFLWVIRDLLFSLFIAFIVMSALKPAVTFLSKRKIPRSLAAIVIYLLFLGLFLNGLSYILPPLIKQSGQLFINMPLILEALSPGLTRILNFEALSQYLPGITGQVFNIVKNIFSNTVFVITTIFFGLYFLIEENIIKIILVKFFEEKKAEKVANVFNRVEKRLSTWFWGEIILMVVVGILSYIGLTLIGLKYALALAVLAGILEVVPNLGPVLAAVPAILIGFSQSAFLGFAALAVSFIVQQLENNLIVPLVMEKVVGLNPIITLMALIIGGKVGGVLGVILAIPATLCIETLLMELTKQEQG